MMTKMIANLAVGDRHNKTAEKTVLSAVIIVSNVIVAC